MTKEEQLQEIREAMLNDVDPAQGVYDLISEKINRTIAVVILSTGAAAIIRAIIYTVLS